MSLSVRQFRKRHVDIIYLHPCSLQTPSDSSGQSLRTIDTGAPDIDTFRQHHQDYGKALRSTGAQVTVLDSLEGFPDSVFVEDAALCLPQGAIAMRPGAPSRLGEAAAMAPTLAELFGETRQIEGPVFIEGEDILVTEREILVGKSARTDAAGVAELRNIVSHWGHNLR
jgi:dimethylargininase